MARLLRKLWLLWAAATVLWTLYCAARIASNLDALSRFEFSDAPRILLDTSVDVFEAPALGFFILLALSAPHLVARLFKSRRQAAAPTATQ